jgi:hypothetical protein
MNDRSLFNHNNKLEEERKPRNSKKIYYRRVYLRLALLL